MELILKKGELGTPFIGICFEQEGAAERTNQQWVNSYRNIPYQVYLELGNNTINVMLVNRTYHCFCVYEGLRYNYRDLQDFIKSTITSKRFNFGHIVRDEKSFKIVRTSVNATKFLLNVDSTSFLVNGFNWINIQKG